MDWGRLKERHPEIGSLCQGKWRFPQFERDAGVVTDAKGIVQILRLQRQDMVLVQKYMESESFKALLLCMGVVGEDELKQLLVDPNEQKVSLHLLENPSQSTPGDWMGNLPSLMEYLQNLQEYPAGGPHMCDITDQRGRGRSTEYHCTFITEKCYANDDEFSRKFQSWVCSDVLKSYCMKNGRANDHLKEYLLERRKKRQSIQGWLTDSMGEIHSADRERQEQEAIIKPLYGASLLPNNSPVVIVSLIGLEEEIYLEDDLPHYVTPLINLIRQKTLERSAIFTFGMSQKVMKATRFGCKKQQFHFRYLFVLPQCPLDISLTTFEGVPLILEQEINSMDLPKPLQIEKLEIGQWINLQAQWTVVNSAAGMEEGSNSEKPEMLPLSTKWGFPIKVINGCKSREQITHVMGFVPYSPSAPKGGVSEEKLAHFSGFFTSLLTLNAKPLQADLEELEGDTNYFHRTTIPQSVSNNTSNNNDIGDNSFPETFPCHPDREHKNTTPPSKGKRKENPSTTPDITPLPIRKSPKVIFTEMVEREESVDWDGEDSDHDSEDIDRVFQEEQRRQWARTQKELCSRSSAIFD